MEENFGKGIISEETLDEVAGGLNISKKALIAALASVGVAVVAASGVSYKIGHKSGNKAGITAGYQEGFNDGQKFKCKVLKEKNEKYVK